MKKLLLGIVGVASVITGGCVIWYIVIPLITNTIELFFSFGF